MKTLIFHIGIPKTGPSALQVFFAKNYAALLERSVDYLQIGEFQLGVSAKISSGNGAFLARSLLHISNPMRMPDDAARITEFFHAVEGSSCEMGIVSSELFAYAEPTTFSGIIQKLRDSGITARVFYYIRSQEQIICSSYMQEVKRHRCTEFPDEYARRCYPKITYLSYYTFYCLISELFGRENVFCRSYEAALAGKDGIFLALLSALNIEPRGLDFGVRDINTSLSPSELAIMMLLNKFKPRMQFSDLLVENSIESGSTRSGTEHNLLSAELSREIASYFAEENQKLARAYFRRDYLFADRRYPSGTVAVSPENISVQDLISVLGGLLVRIDERLSRIESTERQPG